jgi:hypothetical protein
VTPLARLYLPPTPTTVDSTAVKSHDPMSFGLNKLNCCKKCVLNIKKGLFIKNTITSCYLRYFSSYYANTVADETA